ncbi:MAG TPA: hypothetical protein VJA63_00325 [Candidatus Paceibacterota bacterium]
MAIYTRSDELDQAVIAAVRDAGHPLHPREIVARVEKQLETREQDIRFCIMDLENRGLLEMTADLTTGLPSR